MKAVIGLLESGAKKASVYESENLVVTATWQQKPRRGETSSTFLVTIGKPNYAGRQFIKACKKAGDPLPVKKVQLKFYPKKK
jgi:hypothetical protein